MGIYAEYLDKQLSFQDIVEERKAQLTKIQQLRQRDVLVYAADLRKANPSISIQYEDLLPFTDVLSNLSGKAVDVILETPGGFAEIVEDMVRLLRQKYEDVAFIVPGTAKSAGTIMVMSGDDILLEPGSSLGPIDAQLQWQGKVFSAEAFLKGLEAIKDECNLKSSLNRAYIPILQNIHPGEIQHADNALTFAKSLVRDWLARYKFRTWNEHSTSGKPVTEDEKQKRAEEIADKLCKHSDWLSHARSIKIDDFKKMRLRITDYSKQTDLFDTVRRYHTLLQMTFESSIYKVFETPTSQIYRFSIPQGTSQPTQQNQQAKKAIVEVLCEACRNSVKVQLDLEHGVPLENGAVAYPNDDTLKCGKCGAEMNLTQVRRQVELQTKRKVILR